MKTKKALSPPDGAEVERIRKVRRRLERKFKTLDALWDHWVELERKHCAKQNKRQKASASEGRKCAS
ncbi:MAG: hypothetical protein M5U26_25825 [Planctomycetota bacterium]|nr:hypothetical protein [Planctomycetota bacterium]